MYNIFSSTSAPIGHCSSQPFDARRSQQFYGQSASAFSQQMNYGFSPGLFEQPAVPMHHLSTGLMHHRQYFPPAPPLQFPPMDQPFPRPTVPMHQSQYFTSAYPMRQQQYVPSAYPMCQQQSLLPACPVNHQQLLPSNGQMLRQLQPEMLLSGFEEPSQPFNIAVDQPKKKQVVNYVKMNGKFTHAQCQKVKNDGLFMYHHTSAVSVYYCSKHKDCPVRIRFVKNGNLYDIEHTGCHSLEESCEVSVLKKRMKQKIVKSAHLKPKIGSLREHLILEFGIPVTSSTIHNTLRNHERSQGVSLTRNYDLIKFLNAQIVSTADDYNIINSDTATIYVHLFDGSNSVHSLDCCNDTCVGFTFTSKRMLKNVMTAMNTAAAFNRRIPLQIDGTYKLLNNQWVLLILSTTLVTQKPGGKFANSCRPLMMMLCKSESEATCSSCLNSFSYAGNKITFNIASFDYNIM